MKKRILALIMAGALAVGVTACGSSGNADTSPTPNNSVTANPQGGSTATPEPEEPFTGTREIVVGVGADIKTWDPWGMFNIGRQNMAPLIYQALTADVPDLVNNTMIHYNILAESTENIGNKTYQIKIRQGIYDSAGNPFTAEDAIYSFQTCKELARLSQVNAIDGMELVDEYTFNMTLKYDTVGTFSDICSAINMVTQASYEASEDGMQTTPVGTGPMVLSKYDFGSQAILTKSPDFWNEKANETKSVEDGYCSMWDMSNLDVICYKIITNEASMALALETGEIDIARSISKDDAALFQNNSDYHLFGAPEGNYGVSFNVAEGHPTSNYNLRMAIALCLDSSNVLEAALEGDGTINKAWSSPTFVDYQEQWDSEPYFEYDMTAAQEYLAKFTEETGIRPGDLSLHILLQNEELASATAIAVQQYIGQLTGNPNTVVIDSYDRASFNQLKADASAYDMCIINGQVVTRVYSGYEWDSQCNTAKMGYNIFHTDDPTMDELLLAAIDMETTNDETVYAFQQYLNDQCLIKVLFTGNEYGAAASWVDNVDDYLGAKTFLNLGALTYDWNASGK